MPPQSDYYDYTDINRFTELSLFLSFFLSFCSFFVLLPDLFPTPSSLVSLPTFLFCSVSVSVSALFRSLMSSYYDIVRKNFMDLVPKTIMHFLVLFAKDRIESELVEQLYRDEMYDDLLRETDDVAARRKNAESLLTLLKSAVGIVNEVRDFAV